MNFDRFIIYSHICLLNVYNVMENISVHSRSFVVEIGRNTLTHIK